MSTEFTSTVTGEVGFVRWSGSGNGVSYEFGTMTNWEAVRAAMEAGESFAPEGGCTMDSDPATAADMERLVVDGRATFGQFPVTVELGSGEMFQFTVEN